MRLRSLVLGSAAYAQRLINIDGTRTPVHRRHFDRRWGEGAGASRGRAVGRTAVEACPSAGACRSNLFTSAAARSFRERSRDAEWLVASADEYAARRGRQLSAAHRRRRDVPWVRLPQL